MYSISFSITRETYLLFSFVLFCVFTSFGASASCSVTREDGLHYVNSSVSSCRSLYAVQHYCSTVDGQRTSACQKLNALVSVDWNAKVDPTLSPHRGVWGQGFVGDVPKNPESVHVVVSPDNDTPQNAPRAFYTAINAGLDFLEIDVTLAWNKTTQTVDQGTVVLGHYGDLFAAGNYTGPVETQSAGRGFTFTGDWNKGLLFRSNWVRKIVTPTFNNWLDINSFMSELARIQGSDSAILIFDPKPAKPYIVNKNFQKTCYYFCDDSILSTVDGQRTQFIAMIKKILAAGNRHNILHRIVIKIPEAWVSHADIFGPQSLIHSEKVLWVPQPKTVRDTDKGKALTYLDRWVNNSNKYVAFYEPLSASETGWMVKPFQWGGTSYSDISDYLYKKAKRRMGIWIISPAGQLGKQGQYFALNQFLGTDQRHNGGSLLWSVASHRWGSHAMITTDRPLIFAKFFKNWRLR